jgi:hypothetical protein
MAAALGAPSTEKLTRDSFQFWKMQALPAIQGAQAMGLLDGSDAPPPQNLEEDAEKQKSAVPNGAYAVWPAPDQAVFSYLIKGFSPDILAQVFRKSIY